MQLKKKYSFLDNKIEPITINVSENEDFNVSCDEIKQISWYL